MGKKKSGSCSSPFHLYYGLVLLHTELRIGNRVHNILGLWVSKGFNLALVYVYLHFVLYNILKINWQVLFPSLFLMMF